MSSSPEGGRISVALRAKCVNFFTPPKDTANIQVAGEWSPSSTIARFDALNNACVITQAQ